jgi:alkylation response protein AidB-like acyl-CoA dehydrogenase
MNDQRPQIPPWSTLTEEESARLDSLTARLAADDGAADESGEWPAALWAALRDAGAMRWAIPDGPDSDGPDRCQLLERYARVAEGSLTAAFILSQHDAGVRRLLAASDRRCARDWLARISAGQAMTTVGISQLTTSRRHGSAALAAAEFAPGIYRLSGIIPWVTGAERADMIVTGAVLDDGRQLLIALPTDREGLTVQPAFSLAALQASRTSEVVCDLVHVDESDLLAGPVADVLASPKAAGTGGLETSALALGQARAALAALAAEAPKRDDLLEPVAALSDDWTRIWNSLLVTAAGEPSSLPPGVVRADANSLALRATQAYLTARKGTGFLRSEPAQRWARQALFFLVWSCPGPVAQAAIRDLAGLCATG